MSATVDRHGAVVGNEEDYQAAGPRGVARGVAVKGEEGYYASGRYGVIAGERYEGFEDRKAVSAAGATVAVGTMLSRLPSSSIAVVAGGTTCWYNDNAYYSRVYSKGTVAYQVVPSPGGAIIPVLPRQCITVRVGNVSYENCSGTYYQRV